MQIVKQNLGFAVAEKLLPIAPILFDGRTYTEEEMRAKAEESFRAGLSKANADKQAEADKAELARLRQSESERIATDEINSIISNLKGNELGIKGINRFAKEYQEQLKGKTGEELTQVLNQIRESDTEAAELYFTETAGVNASGSLKEAHDGGVKTPEENKQERIGNSTLFRNRR